MNWRHGRSRTKEYGIWKAIHQRCENPNHRQFKDYGGRGIKVCRRWSGLKGFANFIADMGPCSSKATIDRLNNSGDYAPDNCRWAESKQQNRNKRNNHLITAFGKTQCLSAWAEETGIHWATIRYRIVVRGMQPEEAMRS